MVKVRKASEADIPEIRSIAHLGIDECVNTSSGDLIHIDSYFENDEYVKTAMDNDKCIVFVAESENKIVGWTIGFIQSQPTNAPFFREFKRAYLDTIDVIKEERGKGIGKKLIEEVEKWAKEKGLNKVVLEVYKENNNARILYENLGYETIKETRRKKI